MKAALVFFLVVASASAKYAWNQGSGYNYQVTGRSFAALPQVSNDYSGLVYRASLRVQPISSDVLWAKLEDAEYQEIQAPLPMGWEQQNLPQFGQYKPLTLTKQPFKIIMKDGVIRDLQVSSEVPSWEVTMIRSVVSQLQVNTQANNLIPSKMTSLPTGQNVNAVYKTMEETVEGKCEVLYDISLLPAERLPQVSTQNENEDWIEIVKNKNYSNCERRPVYHFGFPRTVQWEPATNQMGDFLSRSAVTRVVVSGSLKSYTIWSSETTSKINLSPEIYNNQKGEVVSQVNVTLLSVEAVSESQLQGPSRPKNIHSLVSDYGTPMTVEEWKEWSEKHVSSSSSSSSSESLEMKKTGSKSSSSSSSSSSESASLSSEEWHQDEPTMEESLKNPFSLYTPEKAASYAKKLLQQIAAETVNPAKIAQTRSHELFAMLTEVVRTMSYQQLTQASEQYYVNQQNTDQYAKATWMAFRDAVSQSGTGPSLLTIGSWLRNKKIQGEDAAEILAAQTNAARVPTSAYIRAFFELVKSREVTEDMFLNTAASFAFSNLVRKAQVDRLLVHNRYPVHTYGPLALKDLKSVQEVYIPYYSQQLRLAVQQQNSQKIQLYIRVLGNFAHPAILSVFEPYLEGKEPMTTFQRTLMVVSLNKLSVVYPKLATPVLYKIYINQLEPYQTRVAAFYNLMKTNPPASLLQRIALAAHTEPSNQVRSAVKTTIEAVAILPGQWNEERRQNAASAVNMLPGEVLGVQYSRANITAYIVQGLNLATEPHFQYIGSKDSILPQSVFFKLAESYNGLYSTGFRFGAMLSSTADLWDFASDSMWSSKEQNMRHAFPYLHRPQQQQQKPTWEEIYKSLNVDSLWKKELEGNILLNWAASQRFMSFSNSSLGFSPENMAKIISISMGETFSYQKRFIEHETVLAFPTVLGFPFMYTFSKPTLMSVSGRVVIDSTPQDQPQPFSLPKKWSIKPDIDVVYSSQSQARFQLITPFEHQFMAGYDRNLQVSIPIATEINFSLANREVKVEIQNLDKNNQKQIFHYSTWPFTTRRDAQQLKPVSEDPNTKTLQVRQPMKIDQTFGEDIVGVAFRVKGRTEKKEISFKTVYDQIVRHSPSSIFAFPTAENTLEATKFEIFYSVPRSAAKSVVFTFTYDNTKPDQSHESSEERDSITRSAPFPYLLRTQERTSESMKKTSIKDASSHALDISVKFNGPKPSQIVASIAASKSPSDEQAKLLVHVHSALQNQPEFDWSLSAAAKMPSVPLYNFERALKSQEKGKVSVKLSYSEKNTKSVSVSANAVFEKTEGRLQHVKEQPQALQCAAEMSQNNNFLYGCRNATFQANLFDKYTVSVDYSGDISDAIKNQTYHLYSGLRYLGYPYMSEDLFYKQKSNQVNFEFQYSHDLSRLNVTVAAPVGRAIFQNLPISNIPRSIAVIHPFYSVAQRVGFASLRQQYESTCSIDGTMAKTFDNMTYPIQLGKAWHVLALSTPQLQEDATLEAMRFAVLGRDISQGQREVRIILEDFDNTVVEMIPSSSRVIVRVNGEEQQLSQGQTKQVISKEGKLWMEITRLDDKTYKIWVSDYKLELLYEPSRQLLTASPIKKHHIGGLCGNFDGESSDLLTPQNNYLKNYEEFVASWTLNPEGRNQELQALAKKHAISRKMPFNSNIVSEQDAGRANSKGQPRKGGSIKYNSSSSSSSSSSESNEHTPKTHSLHKKLKVIERDGMLCFSTEPVPACKMGQKVIKGELQPVNFVCVEKTSTSLHWAKLVSRGAKPDFSKKGNSEVIFVEIPTACSRE